MDRLKEIRELNKLSQHDFGKIFNLAQETVSGYEIGRAEPNLDTIIKISKYFSVSVDYLLDLTDIKSNINESQLTDIELELLLSFRMLSDSKKERAIGMVTALKD